MSFDALLVVLGLFLLPVTTVERTPAVGLYALVVTRTNSLLGVFVMTRILSNHANRIPAIPPEI